jgi:hypothetical protein
MSAALNNVTAPAEFGASAQLLCPDTARVRLQVYNAAIFWRRGYQRPGGGGIEWQPEEFQTPCQNSFDESCDLIQVRAAVKGTTPQVTITTRTAGELGG